MGVPELRIRELNEKLANDDGEYVIYWMTSFRRPHHNFALDRAVEYCRQLQKPLLVFEPLRAGYQWNCDRFHQFVIEGMKDNAEIFERKEIEYFPYVEPKPGQGSGLLEKLASKSCAVVTDDYPCFFIPQLLRLMAGKLKVKLEAIDSNGILPLRAVDKIHLRAHFFRTFLQRNLQPHLEEFPVADPLQSRGFPGFNSDLKSIWKKWPKADLEKGTLCEELPIDHSIKPIANAGGIKNGQAQLREFIREKIEDYPDSRNYPEANATSGLSPYLHFGHVGAHEVFSEVMNSVDWNPDKIAEEPTKKAEGWWGVPEYVEPFLDQLTTWREIGFNMAWQDRNYDRFESLPDWARKTLGEHAGDKRDPCYTLEQFDGAETHDALWNAAQRQLRTEGQIHNYLRMLWGKKILHWSESPEAALEIMIELNNKYALDGRDPNSYSGIFWTLGRYDRAWGPERPIFGKIRYMTSDNTARKFPVKGYVKKYAE